MSGHNITSNSHHMSPVTTSSKVDSPTPPHRTSIRGARNESADQSFNEGIDLLQDAFQRKYFELVNQCKHWERIAAEAKQQAEGLEDENRQLQVVIHDLQKRIKNLQDENNIVSDEKKALEREKARAERRLTHLEDVFPSRPQSSLQRTALADRDVNCPETGDSVSISQAHYGQKKMPRVSLGIELEEAELKAPSTVPPKSVKKPSHDAEAQAIRDSIRQEIQQLRRTSSVSVMSEDGPRRTSLSKISRDSLRRPIEHKPRPSLSSIRSRSSIARAREATGMDPFVSRRESITTTDFSAAAIPTQGISRRASSISLKSHPSERKAQQGQKFQEIYLKISKLLDSKDLKRFHMLIYAFDDGKISLETMLAKAQVLLGNDDTIWNEFQSIVKEETSSHLKRRHYCEVMSTANSELIE